MDGIKSEKYNKIAIGKRAITELVNDNEKETSTNE